MPLSDHVRRHGKRELNRLIEAREVVPKNWRYRVVLAETLLIAGILATCIVVVYVPLIMRIVGGDLPGMYDLYRYFSPHAYLLDVALDAGSPPWWNSLSFCGTPLAANPQAAVFYAPNVLRSLATPTSTPLNAYFGIIALIVLHTIAAGVGMFFLARRHQLGMAASLVAGLLLIFSLAFVRRSLEYHFIAAVAWFPFVMVFLHVAWSALGIRRQTLFAVGAGLCLGMSILSGFLHIVAYLALLVAGYWLAVRLLRLEAVDRDGPRRPQRWILRDFVTFAVFGGVAVAISSAQLIPSWEFAQYTARTTNSDLQKMSMQTDHTLTAFINSMSGYPSGNEFLQGLRLSGVIIYLYAAIAFLGTRRRLAIAFGILALALVDCTLGPPFPLASLIELAVPFKLAYTDRAFIIACIPLALLGAVGFETALDPVTGRSRYIRLVSVIVTCTLLVTVHGAWPTDEPNLRTALICLVFTAITLAAINWLRPSGPLVGLLMVLLVIEIVMWNHHFIPKFLDSQRPLSRADVAVHSQPYAPGNIRRIEPLPNRHLLRLLPVQNGYDPLYLVSVRNFICRPDQERAYDRVLAPSYSVATNNRRMDLLLKRRFWLTPNIKFGPMPPKNTAIEPISTAYVAPEDKSLITEALLQPISESTITTTALVAKRHASQLDLSGTAQVWHIALDSKDIDRSKHCTMLVNYRSTLSALMEILVMDDRFHERTLLSVVAIKDTEERVDSFSVSFPEFASSNVLLALDAEASEGDFTIEGVELQMDTRDENHLITIVSDRFDGVDLSIGPMPGDRMLVFTDANYPGWAVSVDGVEARLLCVDDVFKGVVLPPGNHRVSYKFRPKSVLLGLAFSSFSLLCVCGFLLAIWKSGRRNTLASRFCSPNAVTATALVGSPDRDGEFVHGQISE